MQIGLDLLLDDLRLHLLRFLELLHSIDELKVLISTHLNQITLEFLDLLQASCLQQVRAAFVLLIHAIDRILVLLYHIELPKVVENPNLILLLLEVKQLVILLLRLLEFELLQLLHLLLVSLDLAEVLEDLVEDLARFILFLLSLYLFFVVQLVHLLLLVVDAFAGLDVQRVDLHLSLALEVVH